jgi:hypothetical protein
MSPNLLKLVSRASCDLLVVECGTDATVRSFTARQQLVSLVEVTIAAAARSTVLTSALDFAGECAARFLRGFFDLGIDSVAWRSQLTGAAVALLKLGLHCS